MDQDLLAVPALATEVGPAEFVALEKSPRRKTRACAEMLKIMAEENQDEWGAFASVYHETERALVEAYAKGRKNGGIELPAPDPKAKRLLS